MTGLCVTYIIIKNVGKVTNTIIYININIYAYIMKFEEILKKIFCKKNYHFLNVRTVKFTKDNLKKTFWKKNWGNLREDYKKTILK